MICLRSMVAATVATAASAAADADPTPYEFDFSHTEIRATWNHQGYSHQSLVLTDFDGIVELDLDEPSNSRIDITFNLVDGFWAGARNSRFLDHLASGDLFNVAEHPTARFVATGFSTEDGQTGTMTGDLTLLGETREVSLWVELLKVSEDREGRAKVGLTANTTVSRSEWGMDYAVPAVSDWIGITINTELVARGDLTPLPQ